MTGAVIGQEIRQRLLQALVNAKWSYFTIQPVGRFVAAATTEANWASIAFRNALQVIEQSMRTAIFCGLALFMGWKMALIAIGMGVLMGLSLRTLTRAAHLAGRERQRAMRSLVVELNDVLVGFKPLKAMHRHTGLIAELIKDDQAPAHRGQPAGDDGDLVAGLARSHPDLPAGRERLSGGAGPWLADRHGDRRRRHLLRADEQHRARCAA